MPHYDGFHTPFSVNHTHVRSRCQVPQEVEDEDRQRLGPAFVRRTRLRQKAMAVASLQKLFFEELSSSEDRNAAAASALRRLAEREEPLDQQGWRRLWAAEDDHLPLKRAGWRLDRSRTQLLCERGPVGPANSSEFRSDASYCT